jgi:histidyl-tRNA synthetase
MASVTPPALLSGFRDFTPEQCAQRDHIFATARRVFELYGYLQIQTPAMERLSVLSGKYGEEGEQLMFKVLNSGDFLAGADLTDLTAKKLIPQICERAMRYDLTVPFARYVVMHQSEIALPFKRYQIQNVWRADRASKGRYREFYQCDVDVVGSSSLQHEAEFVAIYDQILTTLGLPGFTIRLNHRQILTALCEAARCPDHFTEVCTAIDKLDKIGEGGVSQELAQRGINASAAAFILETIRFSGSPEQTLAYLEERLNQAPSAAKGIADLRSIFETYLPFLGIQKATVRIDLTLARGLNYYTGTIFEVTADGVEIGSIGGGGRYDDLTGMFGLKNLTGVGISLGADRVHDVMTQLGLFENTRPSVCQALIVHFGGACLTPALALAQTLRANGIAAEVYADSQHKLAKQFSYADRKRIPYTIIIGEEELANQTYKLKRMDTGEQTQHTLAELLVLLQNR